MLALFFFGGFLLTEIWRIRCCISRVNIAAFTCGCAYSGKVGGDGRINVGYKLHWGWQFSCGSPTQRPAISILFRSWAASFSSRNFRASVGNIKIATKYKSNLCSPFSISFLYAWVRATHFSWVVYKNVWYTNQPTNRPTDQPTNSRCRLILFVIYEICMLMRSFVCAKLHLIY